MTLPSEPADSSQEPLTVAGLRKLRDLSLAEPASKRGPAPQPRPPVETPKAAPLPVYSEAHPSAPKRPNAPELSPGAQPNPEVRSTITDEEYRKIRARLREDFIVLPKRSMRQWGAIVGAALLVIALVGYVGARRAGRGAALDFMQTQLGTMVKRDAEDLELETREALARSREATEIALDAHSQVAPLLDSLRKELGSVKTLSARLAEIERALQPAK